MKDNADERRKRPSLALVQAHRTTHQNRGYDFVFSKGYDAGKNVSGIKLQIAVDTQGCAHAVAMATAEMTDGKGALRALQRVHGRVFSAGCA